MVDLDILNFVLKSLNIKYTTTSKLPTSGQRQAYLAVDSKGRGGYVVKVSPAYPTTVARIQREINILSGLNSYYFPKLFFSTYITSERLADVIDNIDPKADAALLKQMQQAKVQPFLITVEEYIESIGWDKCLSSLSEESALVDFLVHMVKGCRLLWESKIVHRDLKPENILIKPSLQPVIIDLGIAKSFKEGTLDLTGTYFHTPCTPQYAAPEQLFNNKADITYKTDQFSIGIIGFWLITKKFPYGSVQQDGLEQVMENIANQKICNSDGFDSRLFKLILKLIQVEPYKRFRNPESILEELEKIKGGL